MQLTQQYHSTLYIVLHFTCARENVTRQHFFFVRLVGNFKCLSMTCYFNKGNFNVWNWILGWAIADWLPLSPALDWLNSHRLCCLRSSPSFKYLCYWWTKKENALKTDSDCRCSHQLDGDTEWDSGTSNCSSWLMPLCWLKTSKCFTFKGVAHLLA